MPLPAMRRNNSPRLILPPHFRLGLSGIFSAIRRCISMSACAISWTRIGICRFLWPSETRRRLGHSSGYGQWKSGSTRSTWQMEHETRTFRPSYAANGHGALIMAELPELKGRSDMDLSVDHGPKFGALDKHVAEVAHGSSKVEPRVRMGDVHLCQCIAKSLVRHLERRGGSQQLLDHQLHVQVRRTAAALVARRPREATLRRRAQCLAALPDQRSRVGMRWAAIWRARKPARPVARKGR